MRDTALYWYIIPSITGAILFFLGIGGSTQHLTIAIVMAVSIGVAIYGYNRWIIKQVYVPKLKKINMLIEALKE
ncbi:MAG: hypothetical protein AAGD88_14370 [Bacteroidota bacterium]